MPATSSGVPSARTAALSGSSAAHIAPSEEPTIVCRADSCRALTSTDGAMYTGSSRSARPATSTGPNKVTEAGDAVAVGGDGEDEAAPRTAAIVSANPVRNRTGLARPRNLCPPAASAPITAPCPGRILSPSLPPVRSPGNPERARKAGDRPHPGAPRPRSLRRGRSGRSDPPVPCPGLG